MPQHPSPLVDDHIASWLKASRRHPAGHYQGAIDLVRMSITPGTARHVLLSGGTSHPSG